MKNTQLITIKSPEKSQTQLHCSHVSSKDGKHQFMKDNLSEHWTSQPWAEQ